MRELLTKGAAGGHLFFRCDDALKAHQELRSRGVELTEEPVDRGYGIDFGLRDPFGNHVRVGQVRGASGGLPPGRGGGVDGPATPARPYWSLTVS